MDFESFASVMAIIGLPLAFYLAAISVAIVLVCTLVAALIRAFAR